MFPKISAFRSLKDLHEEIFEEITLQLKRLNPSISSSFCTSYWNLKLIHVNVKRPNLKLCVKLPVPLPQKETKTQIKRDGHGSKRNAGSEL